MKNTALLLLLALTVAPARTAAQDAGKTPAVPLATWLQVEFGGEIRQVDGDHASRFEMHRHIPGNALLRRFDLRVEREGTPGRFTITGRNAGYRDQSFEARFERSSKLRLFFTWDQFTRSWAYNTQSVLTETSPGVFTAPPGLPARLQAATIGDVPALAASAVKDTEFRKIRNLRERAGAGLVYTPVENLNLRLSFSTERRRGQRIASVGTYVRLGTPTGDTFEVLGQELAEPTEYRTTQFNAGLDYGRQRGNVGWLLSFDYHGSLFGNDVAALRWQNPFRASNQEATGSGGVLERGRFAIGQLALPPDNQAHTFTLSGLLLLPYHTKLSALASWSRWRQDEPFLPYTLNTAIVTGVPAGLNLTSPASLPRQGLQGEINNFNQEYAVASRPWGKFTFTARYRSYDLANETEPILFPGYAAFGESFWRPNISGLPVESEGRSFKRQRAILDTTYRFTRALSWKTEYTWEGWDRTHRQVNNSREHGLRGTLTYNPRNFFYARANYRYANRKPEDYDPGILEFARLRMFDQARRIHNGGDALVSLQVNPRLFFSGSYAYSSDSYDQHFYGLHKYLKGTGGVDLNYQWRENRALYAGYNREQIAYNYLSINKTATPFDPRNTWIRDTHESVDTFNLGFSAPLRKGLLDMVYGFSLGREDALTNNPFPIAPNALLSATAFNYPRIKNQFHELRVNAEYPLNNKTTFGVYYLYEPYRLNDFSTDIASPYPSASLAPENDARRFYFLNARDGNYSGHVVALYVRHTF